MGCGGLRWVRSRYRSRFPTGGSPRRRSGASSRCEIPQEGRPEGGFHSREVSDGPGRRSLLGPVEARPFGGDRHEAPSRSHGRAYPKVYARRVPPRAGGAGMTPGQGVALSRRGYGLGSPGRGSWPRTAWATQRGSNCSVQAKYSRGGRWAPANPPPAHRIFKPAERTTSPRFIGSARGSIGLSAVGRWVR